ncbi:hypothetical protein GDO81_028849 [Engystomops pustulosus]|nr:hypothetical protein GDO81_028849 [Engystomops pustulosus]
MTVTQDKKFVVTHQGSSISLYCEYSGTTATYRVFWYQHKPGKGLELMGYSVAEKDQTMENKFSVSWRMERSEAKKASLQCDKLTSDESAVYFCAFLKRCYTMDTITTTDDE